MLSVLGVLGVWHGRHCRNGTSPKKILGENEMECKSCSEVYCFYCGGSGVLKDGMPCDECDGEVEELEDEDSEDAV